MLDAFCVVDCSHLLMWKVSSHICHFKLCIDLSWRICDRSSVLDLFCMPAAPEVTNLVRFFCSLLRLEGLSVFLSKARSGNLFLKPSEVWYMVSDCQGRKQLPAVSLC